MLIWEVIVWPLKIAIHEWSMKNIQSNLQSSFVLFAYKECPGKTLELLLYHKEK